MELKLTRFCFKKEGIFGRLKDVNGRREWFTLEHSFHQEDDDGYSPKLPVGSYKCVLGTHHLHSNPEPFQTYEVTGVPGHTGILFHVGNYNNDSDGCILVGKQFEGVMVSSSRVAFAEFMDFQTGTEAFNLVVE